MQRTEPPPGDEWTCEGQADLLDELEALNTPDRVSLERAA
jgi:hypothetical protein